VLYDICLMQGVLEAIRVKCAGYPTNRTFIEFLNRFLILAPEILKGEYVSVLPVKLGPFFHSCMINCSLSLFITVFLPYTNQVRSRSCMQMDFGEKRAYRLPGKVPRKFTKCKRNPNFAWVEYV